MPDLEGKDYPPEVVAEFKDFLDDYTGQFLRELRKFANANPEPKDAGSDK